MTVVHALVAPLRSRASAGRAVYLLVGLPMVVAYVVTLLAAAVLVAASSRDAAARLVRSQAGVEAGHLRALAAVPVVAVLPAGASLAGRVPAGLLLRGVVAAVALGGVIVVASATLASLAVPFADGFLEWGGETAWRSSSGWTAAWTLLLAPLGLIALVHLVTSLPAAGARLTARLLAPDAAARAEAELARLRLREAELSERAALAHLVHDSVGHAVTVAGLQATAAQGMLDRDPEFARRALTTIEEVTAQAMADLDSVLAALSGHAGPGTGQPDVPGTVAAMAERLRGCGCAVTVDVSGAGRLPRAIADTVVAVLREGTTNVLRHAGAVPVTLAVTLAGTEVPSTVTVVVANGPGTSPPPAGAGTGRGLSGLATRVVALGGVVRAEPRAGGWLLEADIPVTRAPA